MALQYHIDHIYRENGKLILEGWSLNDQNLDKTVQFKVRKDHHSIPFELIEKKREDVYAALFPGKRADRKAGFLIRIPVDQKETCELSLHSGFRNTLHISLTPETVKNMKVREEQYRIAMEEENLKSHPEKPEVSYELWLKLNTLSDDKIQREKERKWNENAPLFSIVIPLYETDHDALKELLLSVMHQTYEKWELCLADGSHDDSLKKVIEEICGNDVRVHYQRLSENKGISENTNAAITIARGDYIAFCDHDDLLCVNALYEMADAIEKNPDADYLYSDSDNTDETSGLFFNAYFKPDFDPDLLRTVNYINHLSVIRKSFLDEIGYLRKEYDGAQDHDLVLRASEKTDHFVHVPEILYHWRATEGSTAAGMDEKSYASTAGRKAVLDHWHRKYPEIDVERVELNPVNGTYHTVFGFQNEPLVSVILIGDEVEECRKSIEKGNWKNLEFIHGKDISQAVEKAHGEYLLFVHTSLRMSGKDSIGEMVGYAQRKDTGVIGAEIFHEDGRIASAGILVGIKGSYANAFAGQNTKIMNTYFSRDSEVQNVSAVTDDVFMIRKDLYESMHGFDRAFEQEGKVIDFCFRCKNKGLWNVYNPYASFVTTEDQNDWKDQKRIVERYPDVIAEGDPFYNQNLSYEQTDFACRNPKRKPMVQ